MTTYLVTMTKSKTKTLYDNHYLHQIEHGLPVYTGVRIQRGHGLGSIFGSLFRRAVPLLKKGARSLALKGVKAGARAAVAALQRKPSRLMEGDMSDQAPKTAPRKKTPPRKKTAPKKKATPRKKATPKKITQAMYAKAPKDIFQ